MTDDDTVPAETVELSHDDVDHALMLDFESRHGQLDGHAQLYQQIVGLLAYLDQYGESADAAFGAGVRSDLKDILAEQREAIREHVFEEHEHAIRWSLDPHDAMGREP